MKRRFLLGSAVAALARPAIAQSARSRTLVYVPQNNLSSIDPLVNTTTSTINHGYCVFDTLYGVDSRFRAQPQMAEGHTVSDDRLTWRIMLRPGLRFHDNEPVLSRDCVASLQRWAVRDPFGAMLARYVEDWRTPDDRTIEIRLKSPFNAVPDALGHPHAIPSFILPERLAKTDPFKPIPEAIGSGPLKFLADEYNSGSHVAYARFADYVPRDEPAEHTAGGKRMGFDRVEWNIIPDAATVDAALQAGEVDWWELVTGDLIPQLSRDKRITVQISDPLGFGNLIRFNCLQPPFNNPALRRVVLAAVTQEDFLRAVTGDYPNAWRTCYSMFGCGLPGVTEVGAAVMEGEKDMNQLRRAVVQAGYQGEKAVVICPSDTPLVAPLGILTADLMKRLGINVELQNVDRGTLVTRRASKEPVERGGWSAYASFWVPATVVDPVVNFFTRGLGQAGFPGWYESRDVEDLTTQWLQATSGDDRARIVDEIQQIIFHDAPSVPLGLYFGRTAFRSDITGVLPGSVTVPWNVRRI